MSIKITVITAVYNNQETLEQTIKSVLGQKNVNLEYIIIDGASTDGTLDIIKKYDGKIRWISEPDKGIYDALNKGIKLATGNYIQIIGSDDSLCSDDVLSKVSTYLDSHEEVDILCTGRIQIDEITYLEEIQFDNHRNINGNTLFWAPHTGMFVRSSLMKKELFNLQFKIGADYYFILKSFYILNCRYGYLNLAAAYFSCGGISNTQKERADIETVNILKELNIEAADFNDKKENFLKEVIKNMLNKINLLDMAKKIINVYFRRKWRKHHCEWEHCRWCGRK